MFHNFITFCVECAFVHYFSFDVKCYKFITFCVVVTFCAVTTLSKELFVLTFVVYNVLNVTIFVKKSFGAF